MNRQHAKEFKAFVSVEIELTKKKQRAQRWNTRTNRKLGASRTQSEVFHIPIQCHHHTHISFPVDLLTIIIIIILLDKYLFQISGTTILSLIITETVLHLGGKKGVVIYLLALVGSSYTDINLKLFFTQLYLQVPPQRGLPWIQATYAVLKPQLKWKVYELLGLLTSQINFLSFLKVCPSCLKLWFKPI